MPHDTDKLLYSTSEAAGVLGIGKTKLFELLRAGELESVRIGTARLVPRQACNDLVSRLRRSGHGDAVERILLLVDEHGQIDIERLPADASLDDLREAQAVVRERRGGQHDAA